MQYSGIKVRLGICAAYENAGGIYGKEGLTVYEHAKLASQIERAASELLSNASGKINNSLIDGIMRVAGETRALALEL